MMKIFDRAFSEFSHLSKALSFFSSKVYRAKDTKKTFSCKTLNPTVIKSFNDASSGWTKNVNEDIG